MKICCKDSTNALITYGSTTKQFITKTKLIYVYYIGFDYSHRDPGSQREICKKYGFYNITDFFQQINHCFKNSMYCLLNEKRTVLC